MQKRRSHSSWCSGNNRFTTQLFLERQIASKFLSGSRWDVVETSLCAAGFSRNLLFPQILIKRFDLLLELFQAKAHLVYPQTFSQRTLHHSDKSHAASFKRTRPDLKEGLRLISSQVAHHSA